MPEKRAEKPGRLYTIRTGKVDRAGLLRQLRMRRGASL